MKKSASDPKVSARTTAPALWLDAGLIAKMRLLLAAATLLIIYVDPTEPQRYVSTTYSALILYTLYSATLWVLVIRDASLVRSLSRWSHWADLVWYMVLLALSGGINSVLFFGLFFPILVASFGAGFLAGVRTVIASAAFFLLIALFNLWPAGQFELNRFLLRATYLLAFGYMVAWWGGAEILSKQRLALLKEITSLSIPRLGIDRIIGSVLDQLRRFYGSDSCLLLLREPGKPGFSARLAHRHNLETAIAGRASVVDNTSPLLILPENAAFVWNGPHRSLLQTRLLDPLPMDSLEMRDSAENLATVLDAASFATVPIRFRSQILGRLFIVSRQRLAFTVSDLDFLLQVVEHVMPLIDSVRLLDRLASDAAEEERRKIARDIHDRAIQPYIGLQIGLMGVRKKLAGDSHEIGSDIERLLEMTNMGVDDLRGYISGLREPSAAGQASSLGAALQRFAEKFGEATGIVVSLDISAEPAVNDPLAAELFQMAVEGLSNVRRHTQSTQVRVKLHQEGGHLVLCIENINTERHSTEAFQPRSITERAAALGGHVSVERGSEATAVIIDVPL